MVQQLVLYHKYCWLLIGFIMLYQLAKIFISFLKNCFLHWLQYYSLGQENNCEWQIRMEGKKQLWSGTSWNLHGYTTCNH